MTIKITVTIHDEEVAEFELIDNDSVDFSIDENNRQIIHAFMADCADVINDHETNPHLH